MEIFQLGVWLQTNILIIKLYTVDLTSTAIYTYVQSAHLSLCNEEGKIKKIDVFNCSGRSTD